MVKRKEATTARATPNHPLGVSPDLRKPTVAEEIEAAKLRVKELEGKRKAEAAETQAPLRAEYNKAVAELKQAHDTQLKNIRESFKAKGLTFGFGGGSGVMSEAGKLAIGEGTRLFMLAGKPTRAQLVRVYGEKGPKMTWAQRAKAGVPAEGFQAALRAKS